MIRALRRLIARRRLIGLLLATNLILVLYICWGFASTEQRKSSLTVVSDMDGLHKPAAWQNEHLEGPVVNEESLKFNHQLFMDEDYVMELSAEAIDLGSCDKLSAPTPRLLSDKRFIAVNNTTKETFVVSAFYDPRILGRTKIRIIGMSSGTRETTKFCQVWYPRDKKVHLFAAVYELVPETHERKYAPSCHVCTLPKTSSIPYAVSLVERKCDEPSHHLKVIVNDPKAPPRLNFTVCVTPLNFQFNNTYQLVEMIEMNRILGADRLVFYNHTSGSAVSHYLSYYTSLGVTDVIQWDIPVAVEVWPPYRNVVPEIHYFGQLVALNDCLLRYMFVSKYIVFTDLDEFVVPQQVSSWHEMLDSLPCSPSTGAFSFMCTFFRTDWPDNKNSSSDNDISRLKLNTQLKVLRERKIWPHGSRSKLIVRPQAIREIGIHGVDKFITGHGICQVSAVHSLLYHYRRWDDKREPDGDEDRRAFTYKEELVSRCQRAHRAVT